MQVDNFECTNLQTLFSITLVNVKCIIENTEMAL